MRAATLILACTVLLAPLTPAFTPTLNAQPAIPANPCQGRLNIVRVSEIKPGMMDTFLQAVAAQQAWYKSAGTPDEITVMRVMERNAETRAWALSPTMALTTHVEPVSRTNGPAHDAGFDAFVALYKESSTIKTEYVTCMAAK